MLLIWKRYLPISYALDDGSAVKLGLYLLIILIEMMRGMFKQLQVGVGSAILIYSGAPR
jgi:hypothetical protein